MKVSGIETATVIETSGKDATVVTNKSSSCRECGKAQAGICGKKGSGMVLKVENSLGAAEGDTVVIDIPGKTHATASFILFVLPVIALCTCIYAGYLISQFSGIKGLEIVSGFAGLVLSTAYSLIKIHRLDASTRFYITRILHTSSESKSIPCPEETDYLSGFNMNR